MQQLYKGCKVKPED